MDGLTPSQLQALNQLRDLTNGGDDDVAIGVLSSVEWDVQRAADMIFGTGSGSGSLPPRRVEQFEVDDSQQGVDDDNNWPQRTTFTSNPRPSILATLFTYPLHVLSSIFRFVFSVLRIPIPHIPFLSLHFYRPLRMSRGADSWIRDLEEETGAVCIGRRGMGVGVASGVVGVAGPSTLMRPGRGESSDDGRKYLPDFSLGTYEDTLRRCQKEARIGCIVLVSEEHDDDAEFKRFRYCPLSTTLTDPDFVNLLTNNDFIVWGGDVRDLEAYSASEKLQASTYPFVAFVAIQPTRHLQSSSPPPTLTILSRHQGLRETTASKLLNHLQDNVIPRVQPYMERVRNSQRALERDRTLRQQQDQAFADTARRDKERIFAKMAEERRAQEEAARVQREAEQRKKTESERMVWRRWARSALLRPENPSDRLRIAVRLPEGRRLMRRFGPADTLTALYAFVDTEFIPARFAIQDDPPSPSEPGDVEARIDEMGGQADWWGFTLHSAYPRVEVPWEPRKRLGDVACLKDGGGQLIVEVAGNNKRMEKVDDGYDTEDSDD
ncbi:uncharacterized protein BT62DRAFT_1079531 [Guyanagaster necrorhizus]|uniref:UBX domain-containing protein n=1 Tax=Guyanagaster necrorhizus TaxID=856835 RepID=A0A9P8AND9_9AGAR|nr:uncharacterized protein BT62DRAFT_1079531 [Guyanagaster necrorhizus MCA 3950]KAG7442218.1 hypothetical protein BT62DRAFT_1079531 [Guyanagaster necrorhizus MCA 3950]